MGESGAIFLIKKTNCPTTREYPAITYRQPHLLRAAFPRVPFQLLLLAQKDL